MCLDVRIRVGAAVWVAATIDRGRRVRYLPRLVRRVRCVWRVVSRSATERFVQCFRSLVFHTPVILRAAGPFGSDTCDEAAGRSSPVRPERGARCGARCGAQCGAPVRARFVRCRPVRCLEAPLIHPDRAGGAPASFADRPRTCSVVVSFSPRGMPPRTHLNAAHPVATSNPRATSGDIPRARLPEVLP